MSESTREERIQNALKILGDFRPEELSEVFQRMPAATVAARSVEGTDGGRNEEGDKQRKGDAPAPVEATSTEGTGSGRASQSDEPLHPPGERKRELPAEFADSSDLGNAKKQRTESVGDNESHGSQTSATKLLLGHLKAPEVRMHQPESAHSNVLSSVTADQPTTVIQLSPGCPVPAVAVSSSSPANITTLTTSQDPAPGVVPPQNSPAMSMSILERSTGATLNHPVFNNIGGNAFIFKFDGGQFSC